MRPNMKLDLSNHSDIKAVFRQLQLSEPDDRQPWNRSKPAVNEGQHVERREYVLTLTNRTELSEPE